MKCRSFEKQLYLYREGELSPRQRWRLERHLKHCPECAAAAEAIARTGALVADLATADTAAVPPADLASGIMQGLRGKEADVLRIHHPARRGRVALIPALATAALTLLVVMAANEILLMRRINRLENAVTAWSEAVRTGAQEYARLAGTLERLEPILRTAGLFASEDPERPFLTHEEITSWLAGRGLTRGVSATMIRQLRGEVPGLAGIDLEDGLNENEIRMLLQNRDRIATALRGL
jgi:hypothetical protein